MREQIFRTTCDRCKKQYVEESYSTHFSVEVDRYLDAAGSSYTRSICFELCPKCQAFLLGNMFNQKDWASDAVDYVKSLVPNARVMD